MATHALTPRKDDFVRLRTLAAIVAMAIVVTAGIFYAAHVPYQGWQSSTGQIVATRVVLVGTMDASQSRPAAVLYRGEAQVVYFANGKRFVEWLPATELSDNHDWTAFTMSKRSSNTADVLWKVSDPAKGKVALRMQ